MKLRVKTINSTYNVSDYRDSDGRNARQLSAFFGQALGAAIRGDTYLSMDTDESGWVAFNPTHVVSIEVRPTTTVVNIEVRN